MTNDERNPKSETPESTSGHTGRFAPNHSTFLIFSVGFLLSGLIASFGAVPSQPRFAADRAWTTEEGLPDNSVFSLLQTRDGYLWAGTGDGLTRFDGIHFKTFEEVDVRGVNSGKIINLFEDTKGNIWIGTESAGILILDPQGKLTSLSESETGAESRLVTLCEDPSGAVWISTASGHVSRYRDGRRELKVADCNGLAADSAGLIWIGTHDARTGAGKLIGLGPLSSSATAIPVAHEITIGPLDRLLVSKAGGFWLL